MGNSESVGDARFSMPRYPRDVRQPAVCMLLVLALVTACQGTPTTTEHFLPPYLRLRLCGGEAQMLQAGSLQWTTMAEEVSIESSTQITTSTEEGVRICFGDDSTLELAPETSVELSNPRVFPRLQVKLLEGAILFEGTQQSYEFILPECSATLLSVPSRLRIESEGEAVRLTVETGSVTCAYGAETLVLSECQEVYASPGREPLVGNFCAVIATATAEATARTPSPTPQEPEATPSPSSTPGGGEVISSPTPPPSPVPAWWTATATPLPPTDTPAPPPPPTRTQPPPTNTPLPTSTSPPTATPLPTSTPTIRPTPGPPATIPTSTP